MTTSVLERPTKRDQELARKSLPKMDMLTASFLEKDDPVNFEINNNEHVQLSLPLKAFKVLRAIMALMAEGKAFSVIPQETVLSTQQAADILNISRPFLTKLLDSGEIPFHKKGTHRRITLQDLLAYLRSMKEKRSRGLDELASEAQELGLGY